MSGEITLSDRQVRAIANMLENDAGIMDWRWCVGGDEEPLSRFEMLDLYERFQRYLQKPLSEQPNKISVT